MNIRHPGAVALVDWGTSSFRLWILDAQRNVIAERRSSDGMSTMSAPGDFASALETHLDALGVLRDIPILICGMAGARQGWTEAGYVDCPASLSDVVTGAVRVPGYGRDVRILPGVAQRDPDHPDVIRGEETQILGLHHEGRIRGDATIIMPGTHSKWARVSGATLLGFSTHMTGELFAAIKTSTLLKHAVLGAAGSSDDAAFLQAVDQIMDRPADLSRNLFEIRGRQILFGAGPAEATARISGLLIGSELAGGLAGLAPGSNVVLLASGEQARLYALALEHRGISFSRADAEQSTLSGLTYTAKHIWNPNHAVST